MRLSHKEIFSDIYRRKLWGEGSGGGSLPPATAPFAALVRKYGAGKRVLDLGCGDGHAAALYGIEQYTGIDVVPEMVEYCRQMHPWGKFECLDILSDPLPPAELVVCKEVTQHLCDQDIEKLLFRLIAYPAVLHCSAVGGLGDIATGEFRGVKLSSRVSRTTHLKSWLAGTTVYVAELWTP